MGRRGVIDASGGLEVTIREVAVARMKDHGVTPIKLDDGCGRAAAGLEAADRTRLGTSLLRPLSKLRPFDRQLRVQNREGRKASWLLRRLFQMIDCARSHSRGRALCGKSDKRDSKNPDVTFYLSAADIHHSARSARQRS